jgi:hypothetical protein
MLSYIEFFLYLVHGESLRESGIRFVFLMKRVLALASIRIPFLFSHFGSHLREIIAVDGWLSGYSQFDVMSGAELGVHAARRAALRRRIRDL